MLEGPGADRESAVIRVAPAVAAAQALGRLAEDVEELIVTPRWTDERLPLRRRRLLPVDVHVLVPFAELDPDRPFSLEEVKHAAWGVLLRTREEAVAMHEDGLRANRFTA